MKQLKAYHEGRKCAVAILVLSVDVGGDAATHCDLRMAGLNADEETSRREEFVEFAEGCSALHFDSSSVRIEIQEAIETIMLDGNGRRGKAGGCIRESGAARNNWSWSTLGRLQHSITIRLEPGSTDANTAVEADVIDWDAGFDRNGSRN